MLVWGGRGLCFFDSAVASAASASTFETNICPSPYTPSTFRIHLLTHRACLCPAFFTGCLLVVRAGPPVSSSHLPGLSYSALLFHLHGTLAGFLWPVDVGPYIQDLARANGR